MWGGGLYILLDSEGDYEKFSLIYNNCTFIFADGLDLFHPQQMPQPLLSYEAEDNEGWQNFTKERQSQSRGCARPDPGAKVGGGENGGDSEKSRDCHSKKSPPVNLRRDSQS